MASTNTSFHEHGIAGILFEPLKWCFVMALLLLALLVMTWVVDWMLVTRVWPDGAVNLRRSLTLEVAQAERIVVAFRKAEAEGAAAIQVDGQMIDYPVAYRAQALLDGQAGDYREKIAGLQVQILQTQARIVGLSVDRDDKIAAELKDVQNTLHDVEPRLEAARRTLERSELTAPVSDIVTGLTTFTIGGVIKPGEVLMQIVPQDTPLAVVAQVAVRDIEAVKPGLDAVVHLTAFKQRLTPQAHGVVTKVSADRLIEQRTGAPYFEVEVMMKPGQLTKEETANLTPGMPAEVTIPFGDRTALDYLVKPLTDSVRQAFREK